MKKFMRDEYILLYILSSQAEQQSLIFLEE